MKRTPLLLTLAVLFLIAGGYFVYEKVFNKPPIRTWDLVPASTIFVYEQDVCNTCIDEMRKGNLWEVISRASFYGKASDSLRLRLNSLVSGRPGTLISAHVTRKDDFDFVYYLPGASKALSSISTFSQLKGYRYSERTLNEVRIHEISDKQQTFSWILIGDIWVGSFTPFLIEDVVRTHRGKSGFMLAHPEIRQLPRIHGDAGNIYIELKNFSKWANLFLPEVDQNYSVGRFSLLDIKSSGDNVVFNGFSTDSASRSSYLLSVFRGQSPVSFSMKNYIPNRTLTFTGYGVNDGAAFFEALQRFVSVHKRHLQDSLARLSSGAPSQWKDLFADISDEIGLAQLEGMSGQRPAKVLMLEAKDPKRWIQQFNALSEKLSEDTVFYEQFADYEIRELPTGRFPEKLFWPLVDGFDHTYYTAYGNVIFMGDNLEELKYFLEDIEQEDVWGKSVAKNQFLESTLLESNISVFINTPRVWNMILPKLNPRWRQFVRDNQSLLTSIDMSAFQFSHLNNTYYTNVTVGQSRERGEVAFTSSAKRNIVHFPQPVQRLHAGRSHVSQANEILIQDSLNDLSLVSMEGKVLWKIPVGDRITSEIQQIDFYANGKLQYIFATSDAIHIIDRLGNYVPSYPLHLSGKDIRHLSVLDYDRSKRYRFLVTGSSGKMWMYDKTGNNLEGWTPNDAGGELFTPPRHHRIKGRDFILAIRKDGKVYLYNRRGEVLENFPIDLQGNPMGSYFLEMGSNIANTHFVVITRDGYRVKFNPEGKIQSRETLLRAYVGPQFSLVPEYSGKSYLVVQHNRRQMTVSDPAGKKILVSDYFDVDDGSIKYYHYGGGKQFILLTDRVQELSYVFDGNGTMLTNPPLESTATELRMANSDQSYVFFARGKSLTIQPLNP